MAYRVIVGEIGCNCCSLTNPHLTTVMRSRNCRSKCVELPSSSIELKFNLTRIFVINLIMPSESDQDHFMVRT